jgi:hypothetical protein
MASTPHDPSRAMEILTNRFAKTMNIELANGYKEMVKQAEELVHASHGDDGDVSATLREALSGIQGWNQMMIDAETARIVSKRPILPTLNAAAMIAGCQTLFAIRPFQEEERTKFDLRAPELSSVVHKAYIELGDNIQELMDKDPMAYKIRDRELLNICEASIRDALEQCLPFNDIIKYLFGNDLDAYIKKASEQFNAQPDVPATQAPVEQQQPPVQEDESSAMASAMPPIPAASDPPPDAEDDAEDEQEGEDDDAKHIGVGENENNPGENQNQMRNEEETQSESAGSSSAESRTIPGSGGGGSSYFSEPGSSSSPYGETKPNPNQQQQVSSRYLAESNGKQFLQR